MRPLSRRLFVSSAAVALAATSSSRVRAADQKDRGAIPELEALIEDERHHVLEAMQQGEIPGVAVCLVHEGRSVWLEGFGVTDRVSRQAVTPDTLFSIQSTSKNMTAVAVLLAVQEGLLDLDTPITAYLPDFTVHSRFEARPEHEITLRLLLSHRAGFTHEAPAGNNYEPACKDFAAHVRSISDTWLRFPVGERYRYSNLGFDLAGRILEVRSGQAFAEWMRSRLFAPLGMTNTTAAAAVYTASRNRALGHAKGHLQVPLRTPLLASGGVYTSARDMVAYSRFHLGRGRIDGKVILRQELWDEMHGFALGGDYGLGVIRIEEGYGGTAVRRLSHQGGGFGFGCLYEYCPQAGLAWVALFNRGASAGYGLGAGLVKGALRKRYGERQPRMSLTSLAPIALTPAQQRSLVGSYVGRNILAAIEPSDAALQLRVGGDVKPLSFTSTDDAFIADADGGAVTYRYYPPGPGGRLEPAHLECMRGEESLDYNDGPNDPRGPDGPGWDALTGRYRIEQWGVPVDSVTIARNNGWLYINGIRLVIEADPGLFFTSDGEAVDFRGKEPTWRNIRLRRIA